MKDSEISWTHHTFNCWWGCARVSPGCRFCYADTLATHWGHELWRRHGPRRPMSDNYWRQPFTWNRKAANAQGPTRGFCASMADVFEDHPEPEVRAFQDKERARLWDLIEATPNLTWMLLTTQTKLAATPLRPTDAGCLRRIQALQRIGHSLPAVAADAGYTLHGLNAAIKDGHFGDRMAYALECTYTRLQGTAGPSRLASRQAELKGHAPPGGPAGPLAPPPPKGEPEGPRPAAGVGRPRHRRPHGHTTRGEAGNRTATHQGCSGFEHLSGQGGGGSMNTRHGTATAEHRPAIRQRRFAHDDLIAVDLFSGFGGLTQGIERAGFTTIMAANHNRYKVEVHEANHPTAEHWIADLVDPESSDYHSARDLPAGDLLVAGISCVNHSHANTQKAYKQGLSLFDLEDPEFDSRVTRSERDRATANCVLHYAQTHHPRMILVECTTELASWGTALPGKPKVGDGSTYRWWLKQFEKLGYRYRVLYLNSMFFGVPQSRDRLYIAFWDRRLSIPDLDHRPPSWCGRCEQIVEAVWSWRTGVPPTGSVRYGKQYEYRCPSCRAAVTPPMTPSLAALDLTDLGQRIGDRKKPLAAATMARAERCRKRFADFPAVLMPAKAVHGSERHPWQPMATQTSQQETALLSTGMVIPAHRHNGEGQHIGRPMDTVTSTHEKALLSTGALMVAAGNTYERPGSDCRARGVDQPLWTQPATNTTGLITPPIALAVDNYQGGPPGARG